MGLASPFTLRGLLSTHGGGNVCAGGDAEFGEDAYDLGVGGAFGNDGVFGDLAVGQSFGDQVCDLAFPRGEVRQGVTSWCVVRVRRRARPVA